MTDVLERQQEAQRKYKKRKAEEHLDSLRKGLETLLEVPIPKHLKTRSILVLMNVVTYERQRGKRQHIGKTNLEILKGMSSVEMSRTPHCGKVTLEDIRLFLHGNEPWPEHIYGWQK